MMFCGSEYIQRRAKIRKCTISPRGTTNIIRAHKFRLPPKNAYKWLKPPFLRLNALLLIVIHSSLLFGSVKASCSHITKVEGQQKHELRTSEVPSPSGRKFHFVSCPDSQPSLNLTVLQKAASK